MVDGAVCGFVDFGVEVAAGVVMVEVNEVGVPAEGVVILICLWVCLLGKLMAKIECL